MNYFSWIKLISVLIHLKYEQSFPVSLIISVKFYLRPLKPFFVLPHSTTSHRKYCIYQTICKSKQIKFIRKLLQIIIPYGSNTFLRAASLSKLDNMVNNTSLSSVQSMLNFLQNGRYSFIFTVQLVHTTNGTISTKNLSIYSSQFSPLYYTLTCSQSHPYNPDQQPFHLYLGNFSPPSF